MKRTVYLQVQPLLVTLIICGFLLTSCNQKGGNKTTSHSGVKKEQLNINLPAMYTGMLPCADCPSIRYSLIIDENSFTEISIYDNDPHARFEKSGKWKINGDTLSILDSENSPIKRFLVNEESLTLLDKENQEISGALSEMYVLERTGNQPSIRQHHQNLAEEGFKFFANGNEPFWSVKLDSINHLIFETPDSTHRFAEADSSKEGSRIVLKARSESTQITVQTEKKYCRDSMSGYLFPLEVTVLLHTAEHDTLSGCGLYLDG